MSQLQNLISRARILVVDDEAANLKLFERVLCTGGFSALQLVSDPYAALAACDAQEFDVVLLDFRMPGMDGLALMAELKRRLGERLPPIIFVTAETSRETQLRALTMGASDFISKPVDVLELLARVRNQVAAQLGRRVLLDQTEFLEGMVKTRTEELHRSRLEIVRLLGRAAEFRDNETGLHIERMSRVSTLIAEALGWTADRCELMLHASPMHDIGKIAIPDHILLKPGALTDAERELMRSHTLRGAELLRSEGNAVLDLAAEIALNHHERWDGGGYPHGLAGQHIPQSGRIVAVADVLDALTSVRPYKPAWPVEQALQYLRAEAGSHFDPEVVEALVASWDRIEAIREGIQESRD